MIYERHVIPKTAVMAAENAALPSQEQIRNYKIENYLKIKII